MLGFFCSSLAQIQNTILTIEVLYTNLVGLSHIQLLYFLIKRFSHCIEVLIVSIHFYTLNEFQGYPHVLSFLLSKSLLPMYFFQVLKCKLLSVNEN